MLPTLISVRSLLLSVAVLLTGHGLQQTLLPLRAQSLGWSNEIIGYTGSAYFSGFIIGCLTIPTVIRRVGHIRAFAVAVALCIAAILIAANSNSMWVWLVARATTGWGFAGLYMVLESWLNERAPTQHRGAVLSIYTIVSISALALGQLVLRWEAATSDRLFMLVATLLAVAILPVALTRTREPAAPANIAFSLRAVYATSQVAVVCVMLSGMVMGLLWSVGAVYASTATGQPEIGALFTLAVLVGGIVFQFPAGRLSDRFDRRSVILALAIVGAVGAALAYWPLFDVEITLYVAAFLAGGAAMPMYAICIAHANDNADTSSPGQFLQIASAMLVANGVGAVSGPIILSGLSAAGLADALFATLAACFIIAGVWTAIRLSAHEVQRGHFEPFTALPKTTQSIVDLDPRTHAHPRPPNEDPGPA